MNMHLNNPSSFQHAHPWSVIADLIRNPEVKGGAYINTTQPTESPSPLMGEESKVRVIARQSHHRVIPSKTRNLKSPIHITLTLWILP